MVDSLLSWSVFELTNDDRDAVAALCRKSVLSRMSDSDVARLISDLDRGEAVGLSVKDPTSKTYFGLCVLSRERPSPEPGQSLSMNVLTFEPYRVRSSVRYERSTDVTRDSLRREIDRFCRTHGYTRVHCYAGMDGTPVDELLSLGFDFEAAVKTPRGDYYSLASDYPTPYTDDPYDGGKLLQWLAARFRMQAAEITDSHIRGTISLSTLNPHLRGTAAGARTFPMSIALDQATADQPVRIGFGGGLGQVDEAMALTLTEIRELTQSDRLSLEYWPPPQGATSIAVEVRREFFNRFDLSVRSVFFDSGRYGELLTRALVSGHQPFIFFVNFETSRANPELLGFARVVEVESSDPETLWEKFGAMSSWRHHDSFARYRSVKRHMTAIVFEELHKVSRVGVALPVITHSWTYVPGTQAYRVVRDMEK